MSLAFWSSQATCCLVIGDVLRRKQAEFLKVVLRVQIVLVNRLLPDQRVKKVSAFGHVCRRRRGEVALGIHQPAAIRRGRDIEVARDQAGRAIEERERLPAGRFVTENVLARPDANDIHAERRPEFGVHLGQHLVGFVNARRRGGWPDQPLLELVDDGGVNAGDPSASEVHADPVGLAVVQSGGEAFA